MKNNDYNISITYINSILNDIKIKEKLSDKNLEEIDTIIRTIRNALHSISYGDLSYEIKGSGYIIGALKNLQSSLRHLTWQTKAIASGDFSQKIEFLGEFSNAFNSMTTKLESSITELKYSKELFEMFFQTIPDAMLISSLDTGLIYEYNNAFLELSGYSESEIKNKSIIDIAFFKNVEQSKHLIKQLKKNGYTKNLQVTLIKKNKQLITTLYSSQVIIINDEAFVLSIINDISLIAQYEKKLMLSEKIHRLLADNASDVIWTMDLNEKMTYVSPSVEKLRLFTVDEVMNQTIDQLFCNDSLKYIKKTLNISIEKVKANKPFIKFRKDLEQPCKDETSIWTDTTISGIYDTDKNFIGILGVSRDISERKLMEDEIRKLSITDKLTQIYNRLKLDETLKYEFMRYNRSNKLFSLIIMDIDHFKFVNDSYGHQVGDLVLIELANIIKNNVRSIDIIGRWGGEEFLIILPETNAEGAMFVAEKLRTRIFNYDFGIAGKITASFGVSVITTDKSEAYILKRADEALYKAKNNGRNRVELI